MENKPSVEGKINKWKEVKAEYDKWLQTIELKYRNGKTIYTQIAEIFPAILDDLAILKMDFASKLAQRDKERLDLLKRIAYLENHTIHCLELDLKERTGERDHYKALYEAVEKLVDKNGWGNEAEWLQYQSLKIQTP